MSWIGKTNPLGTPFRLGSWESERWIFTIMV